MSNRALDLNRRARYHLFMASSRTRLVAAFLSLAWAAGPPAALADTIFLKNGRKIEARVTREDSTEVVCEREGGEITLPRSLVDHIEKGPLPSPQAPEANQPSTGNQRLPLPLPAPTGSRPAHSMDSPVVHGGRVDDALLRRLDDEFIRNSSEANRERLKQGYLAAANLKSLQGDPEAAIADYRHALKLVPNDLFLTLALGNLLVTQQHFLEAVSLLLPASDHFSQSAELHILLGAAFYGQENLDQAVAEWKKAQAVQDSPRLRNALARAEKEQAGTSSYQELRSPHFLLRYDGTVAEGISGEVLKTLEAVFYDLERDLDFYPTETIVVLLYPNQAFQDITRAPNWMGALYDGKIRVPVSGLTTMTPELASVLKHELTHSFVRLITQGTCPTWFNEGLAQLEQGATTASVGAPLARALASGQIPPLSRLESSFANIPPEQVTLAYAESLAAVEYLRDTQGLGELRRLLRALAGNPNFEDLLGQELRSNYSEFQHDVAQYVEKRYGS